jgi:hypothetical protein
VSDCSSWASSSPVIFLFELFGSTSEVHQMLARLSTSHFLLTHKMTRGQPWTLDTSLSFL